jgi:hypothetical protein
MSPLPIMVFLILFPLLVAAAGLAVYAIIKSRCACGEEAKASYAESGTLHGPAGLR